MIVDTGHVNAQTIADLYRCRWSIEVFFKELKQTLQLADFLGHNARSGCAWTACLANSASPRTPRRAENNWRTTSKPAAFRKTRKNSSPSAAVGAWAEKPSAKNCWRAHTLAPPKAITPPPAARPPKKKPAACCTPNWTNSAGPRYSCGNGRRAMPAKYRSHKNCGPKPL